MLHLGRKAMSQNNTINKYLKIFTTMRLIISFSQPKNHTGSLWEARPGWTGKIWIMIRPLDTAQGTVTHWGNLGDKKKQRKTSSTFTFRLRRFFYSWTQPCAGRVKWRKSAALWTTMKTSLCCPTMRWVTTTTTCVCSRRGGDEVLARNCFAN